MSEQKFQSGRQTIGWTGILATLLIVLLSGCISPPSKLRARPAAPVSTGDRFWWGTATSAFQNEDRSADPGTPGYFQTDWDLFAAAGHAPPRGSEATFSWSRFDKDVRALRRLGVSHFRFSVEWARIEPRPGEINEAALRRYADMARKLQAAGIEPVVTLWHLTFPSWLSEGRPERAGFLHPGLLPAWRRQVARVVKAMPESVKVYVPMNEANGALQLGYIAGHWPPGLLLRPFLYRRATANAVTMFRDAAAIIREERPKALIMSVTSIPHWRRNRLMDPIKNVYNTMMRGNVEHLDQVYDVCDLIGVNYYYTQEASIPRFLSRKHGELGSDHTQLGWEILAEGLHQVLVSVHQRYERPIVVTENGLGTLSEQKKIRYFREHINQMRRARADGVDVRGYFAWTLVDNYEWKDGWETNFGLASMDPRTKELVIQPSGLWYQKFINRFPLPAKLPVQSP